MGIQFAYLSFLAASKGQGYGLKLTTVFHVVGSVIILLDSFQLKKSVMLLSSAFSIAQLISDNSPGCLGYSALLIIQCIVANSKLNEYTEHTNSSGLQSKLCCTATHTLQILLKPKQLGQDGLEIVQTNGFKLKSLEISEEQLLSRKCFKFYASVWGESEADYNNFINLQGLIQTPHPELRCFLTFTSTQSSSPNFLELTVEKRPDGLTLMTLDPSVNKVMEIFSKNLQNQFQQALTATISHEQMNPLNSIINFSRIIYQKTLEFLEMDLDSDFGSKSSNSLMSKMLKVNQDRSQDENQTIEVKLEDMV